MRLILGSIIGGLLTIIMFSCVGVNALSCILGLSICIRVNAILNI